MRGLAIVGWQRAQRTWCAAAGRGPTCTDAPRRSLSVTLSCVPALEHMMGSVRRNDLDRGRAERLLQGEAVDGGALRDILAAASSQARPVELTGEDAVVAAFRAERMFR